MGAIAAGIVGGAALSAGGGMMGAASQNRAGRQARNRYGQETSLGYQRLLNMLYGPGAGSAANWSVPGGTPPTPGANSILGRQQGIADLYAGRAAGIRSQFGRGAANLDNLYRGSEGLASRYGQGGEALIDQESARALKGANQRAMAGLAASGFGNSTMGANQTSQNALNSARMAGEQKLALRNQALQTRLGVRGQRAVSANENLGRSTDLATNTLQGEIGLRQQPIQTELSAGMSSIANPWLNQNMSQYFPGYSPGGTALNSTGNTASTVGGMLLMRNLYGNPPPPGQGGAGVDYGGMLGDGGGGVPGYMSDFGYGGSGLA